ncbi:MAG: beta-glucosidase [Candidatus Azotimanducaceae bacterium]|jgi:beta-glucosidase
MLVDKEEAIIDERLQRLSLREKVGQMTMAERMSATPADVAKHGLGCVLSGGGSHPGNNSPADWVSMNEAFWVASMESSAKIPALFGIDAVHGHNNVLGATIFPHNIAFGAAGEVPLVANMAKVTAREILASGLDWNFAPTLAVAQNCQWGRTYESFGADPEKAAVFGEAYVTSLQNEGVIACVKHWVGDGATTYGIDQGEASLDWETLEKVHMSPYYPSLEAGVLTVMVSFNSWNGDKCHGHRQLVTDVLKTKLGFEGVVVSDWDGIDYLDDDYDAAICKSVNAGVDMFMTPEKWLGFIEGLIREVEAGRVSMDRIDDAVRRILRVKLRYGLFDLPRPSERRLSFDTSFGSAEHRNLAREVVRKSLVLLKNDHDILPLKPAQRIFVAGKSARNLGHQCGGWTFSWQGEKDGANIAGTTIWEGISSLSPSASLSEDLSGTDADPAQHDVAVVVIGETPYAEGFGDIRPDDNILVEAGSRIKGSMNPLEPYARTLALSKIHPEDLLCIQTIRDKGIPVVVVLISGRPLVVNEELAASAAFVAGWLPGAEGLGVAEVLLGQAGFQGKLPLPWPLADVDRTGGNDAYEVLFPMGFGLDTSEETLTALSV